MTDTIDLDEIDVQEETTERKRGDWFWKGEGDPADEPAAVADAESETDSPVAENRVPRVPRENEDKPVGIPRESGGGGGTTAESREGKRALAGAPAHGDTPTARMTTAFTYRALSSVDVPAAAVADSKNWGEYVGIVGDVPAHVIQKFQRDHTIDADFFNGAGTEAAERLASIDEHSMFHAERMVVIGYPEEESIAEAAGWEFIPIAEAAAKADWTLEESG
ncbi:DUF7124 domain-containing protein [Natronomonas sp. EA1]|uniref:DUF7124 domain-containing protein n=1 Tax=Natronomonas sp. EA1 TaxID=3421655 RepID=UPI003EBD9C20